MLAGLHSDAATGYGDELSQALKASSRAASREKEGAPLRMVFTRQQSRAEGPSRPRICRRLRAMVAVSEIPSGPGCQCRSSVSSTTVLGE